MSKEIDISGKRFCHLTAIRFDHKHKRPYSKSQSYWLFKCDCGREKVIDKYSVTRGRIKSCGCGQHNHSTTHGLSDKRIYRIWKAMKSRCYNKNQSCYNRYGGVGITICPEWLNDFMSFYNWSLSNGYNDALSIDRIDYKGNYCPENCRWATTKQQSRNTSANRMITFNNETLCLTDWSNKTGIKIETLESRLKSGWSIEKTLTTKTKGTK